MGVSVPVRSAPVLTRVSPVLPAPPVRLRAVLLVGLFAWGVVSLYPRLQAAFQLHDATTGIADYALCMVGPTGPALVRDRAPEFPRLVRRRLLAAVGSERPFAKCGKIAGKVSGRVEVERAHAALASDFREYGGTALSLSALEVPVGALSALAEKAWPFARGGYTKLIKPSLGASEAAHLPAPARPLLGKGLPARAGLYRNVWQEGKGTAVAIGMGSDLSLHVSSDRGVNFRSLGRTDALLERHAERCQSQDGSKIYRLTPREDGSAQLVVFSRQSDEAAPDGSRAADASSELSSLAERTLAIACDERSLMALSFDQKSLRLRACPFGGRCGELPLPSLLREAPADVLVDVAKIKGVTVVSAAVRSTVRVVSSRDEGRTFTPPIVAFDAGEYPDLATGRRPPSKLLALDDRLLLFGGGLRPSEAYPLLASDDQGVSFRTP